jgi:hypothetical protein
VALNFDQNSFGTATPFGYDESRRRAVFLHSELILRRSRRSTAHSGSSTRSARAEAAAHSTEGRRALGQKA